MSDFQDSQVEKLWEHQRKTIASLAELTTELRNVVASLDRLITRSDQDKERIIRAENKIEGLEKRLIEAEKQGEREESRSQNRKENWFAIAAFIFALLSFLKEWLPYFVKGFSTN